MRNLILTQRCRRNAGPVDRAVAVPADPADQEVLAMAHRERLRVDSHRKVDRVRAVRGLVPVDLAGRGDPADVGLVGRRRSL